LVNDCCGEAVLGGFASGSEVIDALCAFMGAGRGDEQEYFHVSRSPFMIITPSPYSSPPRGEEIFIMIFSAFVVVLFQPSAVGP